MECNGLHSANKRAILKNLFRDWIFDLICLQETKLDEVYVPMAKSIWSCSNLGFVFKRASGSSEGHLSPVEQRRSEVRFIFSGFTFYFLEVCVC